MVRFTLAIVAINGWNRQRLHSGRCLGRSRSVFGPRLGTQSESRTRDQSLSGGPSGFIG